MRHLMAAACVLGFAGTAWADTLTVPSEAYPSLQAAVDAAESGDTILLLPGTLTAGADIVGKSNLRIVGKPGAVIALDGENGLDFTICTGIQVSGITIQGANNGLYFIDCIDVTVSRVVLADISFEALGINGCQDVVVSRCTFDTVGGKGVEDDGSTGLVVDRCVFTACAEGAVVLSPAAAAGFGSNGARVTRCAITGPSPGLRAGGTGMVVDRNRFTVDGGLALDLNTTPGADGSVITRNLFTMAGTDRSASFAGDALVFSRNRIVGGGVIEAGAQNRIERNRIDASNFGISVNGTGATILGNRLADLAGHGLDVSNGDHVIGKNVIERCLNTGIYLSASNSDLVGNRITDAEYGIVVVYGGNYLTGNRVAGETVLDLLDFQNGGPNEYGKNAFRTTQFGD